MIDETFNDLVAINKIVTGSLHELGGRVGELLKTDSNQNFIEFSGNLLQAIDSLVFFQ